MTTEEIAKVHIFDFDRDIIAALSEEDAVKLFQNDTGYQIEECQPKRELPPDQVVIIDKIDEDIEGVVQQCPYCGTKWKETTFRELLKDSEYRELPFYVAGRD